MPKKLEIIFGEKEIIGEKIADRTIKAVNYAKNIGRNYIIACAKGSSPKEFYEALKNREHSMSFLGVFAFCIDEDLGTTNSYDFLRQSLPAGVAIQGIRTKFYRDDTLVDTDLLKKIHGTEEYDQLNMEVSKICKAYEGRLRSRLGLNERGPIEHPIDLAIMGLGVEPPHIGSNFPPVDENSRTYLAEKVDTDGNIVGYALTMGVSTLCSAKEGILFAYGGKKADCIKETLEGPISKDCPPSYLRNIDNLTVALDEDSVSKLDLPKLTDTYEDRHLVITHFMDMQSEAIYFDSNITDRDGFCGRKSKSIPR